MANMRIRELRKAAGLTQTAFADNMGVTQTIVSDWENEVYLPKARELPRMAAIFGCSIDSLFCIDRHHDATGEEA